MKEREGTTKAPRPRGGSMVALHLSKGELKPVEELAEQRGMSLAILAGLRRATGWAEGKQVTAEQFKEATDRFQKRPMGSGRI